MCSAICSRDVRMCSHEDGTAGQEESPATSLCAGTNGIGNYATRKSSSVRNAPTGHLNSWSMRISTDILKGKARTGRMESVPRPFLPTIRVTSCARILMTSPANMDTRKMCWRMSGSARIGIFLVPLSAPAQGMAHMSGYSLNSRCLHPRHEDLEMQF